MQMEVRAITPLLYLRRYGQIAPFFLSDLNSLDETAVNAGTENITNFRINNTFRPKHGEMGLVKPIYTEGSKIAGNIGSLHAYMIAILIESQLVFCRHNLDVETSLFYRGNEVF